MGSLNLVNQNPNQELYFSSAAQQEKRPKRGHYDIVTIHSLTYHITD